MVIRKMRGCSWNTFYKSTQFSSLIRSIFSKCRTFRVTRIKLWTTAVQPMSKSKSSTERPKRLSAAFCRAYSWRVPPIGRIRPSKMPWKASKSSLFRCLRSGALFSIPNNNSATLISERKHDSIPAWAILCLIPC